MKAKIFERNLAIKLRKKGKSLREIEKIIGIPRSTLSRWLHTVKLSEKQIEKLRKKWLRALAKGRAKAIKTHQEKRVRKINKIKREVEKFMSKVSIDKTLGELLFGLFYLSEGTKRESGVVIANSDPEILKGILNLFRYLYRPKEEKFRCCLHLRKDQDEETLKNFWSRMLKIPKKQFYKSQFDKRTKKPTTKNYKGVCVLQYFDSDLQRRILYIGEELIRLLNNIKVGA